jgi:DNA-binding transcriptional ArsR family regulator
MEPKMVTLTENALDRTFHALAHPTRRAILTRLARGGAASVGDLAEPFDVTLMAVSKHLTVMEEAGLIRREKDGRVHRCSYQPGNLEVALDWIELHRRYWERQLDALASWFEEGSGEGATTQAPGVTSMTTRTNRTEGGGR